MEAAGESGELGGDEGGGQRGAGEYGPDHIRGGVEAVVQENGEVGELRVKAPPEALRSALLFTEANGY